MLKNWDAKYVMSIIIYLKILIIDAVNVVKVNKIYY